MKSIDLDELKKVELRILMQIRDVCDAQGIQYSLCGGTLLGAVRHKGFIPWDDDIDITMLRPDYNKFIDYCANNDTPFEIMCHGPGKKNIALFDKAYAPDTVLKDDSIYTSKMNLGIFVDIFPADYLGDTYDEAKANYQKSEFARELLVARHWERFSLSTTHAWFYEPVRLAFYLLSRLYSAEKLVKSIENKYDDKRKSFAGCLGGSYRLKEIMSSDIFEELTEIEFENETFKCYKNYEKYLSNIYGDYMQLPPEEKRISHHSFTAYYK